MVWQLSGALALAAFMAIEHGQISNIEPGQWETTITMDIPGLGGESTSKNSYCVSAEESAAGPRRMFEPEDSSCEMLSYSYGEGTLAMEMQCLADGGELKITTMGSFTERTYEMTSMTEATFGGAPMSMTSKIFGRHLGPCDPVQ